MVTAGQPAAPEYFVYNAILNRKERERPRRSAPPSPPLDADAVAAALARGAVVIDARDPQEFAAGHLRGAINVPVDGRMAETVGMVVGPDDEVVLIAPEGEEQEAAIRLVRIGFDHAVGYVADVEGYLLAHQDQVDAGQPAHAATSSTSSPATTDLQIVDVRNEGELAEGRVPGSVHIPLAELARRKDELDPDRPTVLYCAGGWRSSVGASLLRSAGFADVSDVLGGFAGWDATQRISA